MLAHCIHQKSASSLEGEDESVGVDLGLEAIGFFQYFSCAFDHTLSGISTKAVGRPTHHTPCLQLQVILLKELVFGLP